MVGLDEFRWISLGQATWSVAQDNTLSRRGTYWEKVLFFRTPSNILREEDEMTLTIIFLII